MDSELCLCAWVDKIVRTPKFDNYPSFIIMIEVACKPLSYRQQPSSREPVKYCQRLAAIELVFFFIFFYNVPIE